MDEKRSSGRAKRQAKVLEEGFWDCSVCTYKNSPEAYKCEMCDVRKGTSTRKPRINPQLVAQQKAQQFVPPPKKDKSHSSKRDKSADSSSSQSLSLHTGTSIRAPVSSIDHTRRVSAQCTNSVAPERIPLSLSLHTGTSISAPVSSIDHTRRVSAQCTNSVAPERIPVVPRLKNVDRSRPSHLSVTVGNVTVVVTDYQPKPDPRSSDSHVSSDASDTNSVTAPDLTDDSSRDAGTT